MKLSEKQLELKKGLTQEWLITNGIGGFSSQTVLGINTRKYHGLLVAPLVPPSRRFLILSKMDESIRFEDGSIIDVDGVFIAIGKASRYRFCKEDGCCYSRKQYIC